MSGLKVDLGMLSTYWDHCLVGRREPDLCDTQLREGGDLGFKMLPPAHGGMRTIPSKELDLRFPCQLTVSLSKGTKLGRTMSGFGPGKPSS